MLIWQLKQANLLGILSLNVLNVAASGSVSLQSDGAFTLHDYFICINTAITQTQPLSSKRKNHSFR